MTSPFASENSGNVMAIIVFGSKLSVGLVGLVGIPGPLVGIPGSNKKKQKVLSNLTEGCVIHEALPMLSVNNDPKKLVV